MFNHAWYNNYYKIGNPSDDPLVLDFSTADSMHPQYDDSGDGISHQNHIGAATPPPTAETDAGDLLTQNDGGLGEETYL